MDKLFGPSLWDAALPDPDPSYSRPKSWKETIFSWGNSTLDLALVLVNCAKDFVAPLKAYSVAVQIITLVNDIKKNYLTDKDCRDKYKSYPKDEKKIRAVASFDPNEIVGPSGYGEKNYVSEQVGFSYTIYFENLKTATAPAQEVIIIDTLDSNVFDFQSFAFGRVSWGNNQIYPLPNMKEFTIDVPLDHNQYILRISGNFDTTTGIVKWHYMTLDTSTMDLSEDPDAGFLPPNVNSPEGEGSVHFVINLKNGLLHNTLIQNQAEITFDVNEPIKTNVHSNRIDLNAPTSKLDAIYKISYMEPNFYKITGTATDEGSGVAFQTVYASMNDGEYFPLTTLKNSEVFFQLDPDSLYKFYSIAVDSVGNYEREKTNYEVSTLNVGVKINEDKISNYLKIYPNPTNSILNINCNFVNNGRLIIYLTDMLGRNVIFENVGYVSMGEFTKQISLEDLKSGTYILTIQHNQKKYLKFISIQR